MKKIYIFTLFLSALILTGCEETKSVEWWTEHHDEAVKKEAECKKSGSDSQNCRNVKEANFRYQQLHAKEPSFKDYFKKQKEKNAQKSNDAGIK
ncbi:EexN family lipoprotein [Salmonella enterica]|nr:entry exclusion protein [Salmonella enterica]EIF5335942.1 EexN family lipoprotein [Salmonella enterica]EJO5424771.1 EexN family lipoprotein [Salmonella enterica]HAS9316999.1 EexN family lipoprotein [Salmonella enterica subsp. enterica serovar Anatum]